MPDNGYAAHPGAPVMPGLFALSMRVPPQVPAAEQSVLGSLMSNNQSYEQVADFLLSEHFYDPLHARLYAAIQRRLNANQVADFITLRPEFENTGELDGVGGVNYLASLMRAGISPRFVEAHGRQVQGAWRRRRAIEAASLFISQAYAEDPEVDFPAAVELMDSAMLELAEGHEGEQTESSASVAQRAWEETVAAMERKGALRGVATGYRGLDRMLGGMVPGQLIVLAGRPGMGKSALAGGIAWRAAEAGKKVLFVSAEMDSVSIFQRGRAAVAGLPISAAILGVVEVDGERRSIAVGSRADRKLVDAGRQLGQLPVDWYYQGGVTLAQIRAKARRMKRRGGLDLVIIDYLQLMRAPAHAQRYGNKVQEVGELSKGCKELAVELGVPVLLLSQLSRAVEQREDKRPQLSDLRDSGTIEQDADVVMFAYREHYYLKDRPPARGARDTDEAHEAALSAWQQSVQDLDGRAEIIIRKQRQGPTGPVRMLWEPVCAWFRDESETHNGPAVPGIKVED